MALSRRTSYIAVTRPQGLEGTLPGNHKLKTMETHSETFTVVQSFVKRQDLFRIRKYGHPLCPPSFTLHVSDISRTDSCGIEGHSIDVNDGRTDHRDLSDISGLRRSDWCGLLQK